MWDYEPNSDYTEWKSNEHKYRIHHISRSGIVWTTAVEKYPKYREMEDEVLHAILSHHGLRQWGSPVEPRTRLAWLLHLSDGISARMDDCYRRLKH